MPTRIDAEIIMDLIDAIIKVQTELGTDVAGTSTDLKTRLAAYLPGGATAFTAGSIVFSNGTTFAQDNANLFWDDGNNRLGVGTATPTVNITSRVDSDGIVSTFALQNLTGGASSTNEEIALSYYLSGDNGTTLTESVRLSSGKENDFVLAADRDSFFSIDVVNGNVLEEKLRITSSGNVGIGTITPVSLLHASKAGAFADILRVQNPTAGTDVALLSFSADATYAKAGIGFERAGANGVGNLVFYMDGVTDAADLDASNEIIRIDSSGNVGIGTAVPAQLLHVEGAPTSGNAQFLSKSNSGTNVSYGGAAIQATSGKVSYWTMGDASYSDDGVAFADDANIYNTAGVGFGIVVNGQSTRALYIDTSGSIFIGDTSNANMTQGLTINQGANDDEILALKSSDVAHGMTTLPGVGTVETDDFCIMQKVSAANGGLSVSILANDAAISSVLILECLGGTASTTDTTTDAGLIDLVAGEHDGANAAIATPADANLFSIRTHDNTGFVTRLLLKADDGELHLGNSTPVALDEEDDLQAVRALQKINTQGKGIIPSIYDRPLYDYDKLHELGVVGTKDSAGNYLIRVQPYLNLHDGALWQLGIRSYEHESRLTQCEQTITDQQQYIAQLESKITHLLN